MVGPPCARGADHVITISEFSRKDILDLIPRLDPTRVHVTHLSCDHIFKQVRSALAQGGTAGGEGKRPYIFTLGADDPRKNTVRLVQAYLSLLKDHAIEHDLVISGYANWEQSESYQLVKDAGATSRVRFLGFIAIEELMALYRGAEVFVYASLYEGFGIPILEAFSAGCPVIASNVTSIPEVGGDAALYFDPLRVDDMRTLLLRVLKEPELRESLSRMGYARAQQFSWEETARQTLAIYEACLSNRKAS
jgi:alpha-1,3-rhamnosyl/mannosyltransferase